jgi:hypothetical protein
MDEQNLDIYGHDPIPWTRAPEQLEAQARNPTAAVGVAIREPQGATRWRFDG